MKHLGQILRYSLNTLFLLLVLGAIGVYMVLHFNLLDRFTRETVAPILAEKLNTHVEIGEAEINWLNQLALNDVVIYDQQEDTLLYVRRAMVSYEMIPLLKKKLKINTIQLIEFDTRIRQESPDSEPNFKFIVDALAPNQDKKRKFINDFSLNALNLRRGRLSYQLGEQTAELPFPDYKNLQLTDITAALQVEVSHISGIDVVAKRFSFKEKGGLSMACQFTMHDDSLHFTVNRLALDSSLPAQLSLSGVTHMSLYHPLSAQYVFVVEQSQMGTSALQRLSGIYGFNLPQMAELWRDSLEMISMSGTIRGLGMGLVSFDGNISTSGRIITSTDIQASYDTTIVDNPLSVKAQANIRQFPYNRHTYRNIRADIKTNGKEFHALVDANDPALSFKGKGDVALQQQSQEISFDADIYNFNPYALHLSSWSNLEDICIEGHTAGTLHIQKGEWPLGKAAFDSLILTSPTDTLCLDSIRLDLHHDNDIWSGTASAPFLKCNITQTSAQIDLPENRSLAHLLRLPVHISKEANIVANWDSTEHKVTLECEIPELMTADGAINALLKADGQSQAHSPIPQQMRTSLAFDYITPKHMMSSAMVADIKPTPLLIEVESAEISIDGHPFSSEGAILSKEANRYMLSDFTLRNGDEELSIYGSASNGSDIKAHLHANELKIDFLLDMLGKKYLNFGGYASGDISLSNDSLLCIQTEDLFIRDFSYMDRILGDNYLTALYDVDKRDLYLNADINNDGHHSRATGEINIGLPGVKAALDLNLNLNQLPLDFCHYWIGGFIHDLHGTGTGNIRLFGASDELNLLGHPYIDANFTHDLLGARFNLTDTIHFETADSLSEGRIRLNHAKLNDRYNQTAYIDGLVKHRYLTDYDYDINVGITPSNNGFMLYDYPNQRPGEMYWGQLFGNGQAHLYGSTATAQHRIGVQMEPAGKSVLYLSPGEKNFSDNAYNFLVLREKIQVKEESSDDMLSHVRNTINLNSEPVKETYIEADLQIHANERCLVNMQMDPLAEDRLLCRGSGDITLHYDTNHDLGLTGTYNISSGSYTITMKGDLMSKSFQLQNGSMVSFSGTPSEADLNLNAVYNIPSANLKDLDENLTTAANLSRSTLPVDCKLFVNGSLSAPQITFDLEVKNVSDDIQTLVHNIIGTPEMLSREVFYLLLFGRFYTPEYASTSSNNTNGLSSFASAALTSQLNNLLGHMSDNFSLGTNFHSDKGDFTDMEMDVSLQTRLFSDRLLLSGNLSYRDPANNIGMAQTNTSFIGDFDVEYLINPTGTLRAKAYSHYNQRYYNINNSLTTQGIGIVVRRDFKSIKDMFPWQPKKTK